MNYIKLNKFLLELDNKYDINSGACALVASMIAKYCEDHNIQYKVKIYYYDNDFMCAWHYALVIDNIEINPSTYKYQNDEYEISHIENCWNSEKLLKIYNETLDDWNYFKKYKQQEVKKLINMFLNNE